MKVCYYVPYLNSKGGIQSWAYTTAHSLASSFSINFIDPKENSLFDRFIKVKTNQHTDLIHFWSIDGAVIPKNKPYIVTCHGLDLISSATNSYNSSLTILKNAHSIIVNSNYTNALLRTLFPIQRKKIITIHPSIQLPDIHFYTHTRHFPFSIGTISRLIPRKDIVSIIRALQILRDTHHIDFVYHLAGTGPELSNIVSELKKTTYKWTYWGEISEEMKQTSFYPSIDLFIMTPKIIKNDPEGFGIVYLEANSYGIPVVGTNIGGSKEAIQPNNSGIIAKPENPEDIAGRIAQAIKHHSLLSIKSKAWAKKFASEMYTKTYEKLYNTATIQYYE